MIHYLESSPIFILRRDILQKFFSFMIMLAVFCLVAPIAGQAIFRDLPKPILFMTILNILLKRKLLRAFQVECL